MSFKWHKIIKIKVAFASFLKGVFYSRLWAFWLLRLRKHNQAHFLASLLLLCNKLIRLTSYSTSVSFINKESNHMLKSKSKHLWNYMKVSLSSWLFSKELKTTSIYLTLVILNLHFHSTYLWLNRLLQQYSTQK